MRNWMYIAIYLAGLLVSSFAQILLKISAGKTYPNKLREYLNPYVIIAYIIYFGVTFCTMYAYKGIPLSFGPILAASEYIFVAVLSRLILKEKIKKMKLAGLAVIVAGIVVYAL